MRKTYRDMLHILFKHRKKSLAFLASILAFTFTATLLMSRIYVSSSKLLVKIGREDTYSNPVQESAGTTLFDSSAKEERINSEIEILTSRPLIESVIRDVGLNRLYPDIAESFSLVKLTSEEKGILKLQKKLKVEPIRKSDIIRVQFHHEDKNIAAEVVNRVMARFIELHSKVHQQGRTFAFFDQQAESLNKKLLDSEKDFDNFRSKHNISSLQEQKSLLLQQISETEIERAKTASEIKEVKSRIDSLITGSKGAAGLGQETDLNPHAISAVRSQLSSLRLKEQELRSKYADGSYMLRSKQDEINRAAELLEKEEMTYNRKAVRTLQQTLKSFQDKEASQKTDLNTYRRALQKISGLESKANDIERELKINEENYRLYVKRMEEARITQAMDRENIVNVSIAEAALPPIKPISPKPVLNMALALGIGLIGAIGLAFISEFLGRNFNKSEDAEQYLQLPVLSSIREIGKKDLQIEKFTERKQLPYHP